MPITRSQTAQAQATGCKALKTFIETSLQDGVHSLSVAKLVLSTRRSFFVDADAVDLPDLRNCVEWATFHLADAVDRDDEEGVKRALAVGVNDVQFARSFVRAAYLGNDVIMKAFLHCGADPNALADYARPVLFNAVSGRHAPVVDLLLRAGGNPDTRCWFVTPLWEACKMEDETVIDLLLSAGADPFAADCNGQTPLQIFEENHFYSFDDDMPEKTQRICARLSLAMQNFKKHV